MMENLSQETPGKLLLYPIGHSTYSGRGPGQCPLKGHDFARILCVKEASVQRGISATGFYSMSQNFQDSRLTLGVFVVVFLDVPAPSVPLRLPGPAPHRSHRGLFRRLCRQAPGQPALPLQRSHASPEHVGRAHGPEDEGVQVAPTGTGIRGSGALPVHSFSSLGTHALRRYRRISLFPLH